MADEQHLKILKQGVKTWNLWREEYQDIRPDLSLANLSLSRLEGINFKNALLKYTIFDNATINGTDFTGAEIERATFVANWAEKSIFTDANLNGSYFSSSILWNADFRNAILTNVVFRGWPTPAENPHYPKRPQFDGADFANSMMGRTIFGACDLSGAKGLTKVRHIAPSSIDINSFIFYSGNKLPLSFLRGCGIPNKHIGYIRSIDFKPNEFYSCFISYSSKDLAFVKRLHADLQSEGVQVWFAPDDLNIGEKFRSRFDDAILKYDKVLIILSKNSIHSSWVEKEVETAFEKEQRQNRVALFPIRLDNAIMEATQAWAADIRRTRHIGDFRKWRYNDEYQKEFTRLLNALNTE